MPRPVKTLEDNSRIVLVINGASMIMAVLAIGIWLVSSPDLPGFLKLGSGLLASMTGLAFVAVLIHRATTKATNILQFPAAA